MDLQTTLWFGIIVLFILSLAINFIIAVCSVKLLNAEYATEDVLGKQTSYSNANLVLSSLTGLTGGIILYLLNNECKKASIIDSNTFVQVDNSPSLEESKSITSNSEKSQPTPFTQQNTPTAISYRRGITTRTES